MTQPFEINSGAVDVRFFRVSAIYGMGINAGIFYINYMYLMPKYFTQGYKRSYWQGAVLMIAIATASELFIDGFLLNTMGLLQEENVLQALLVIILAFHGLTLLASFAARFSKDHIRHEARTRTLREENLKAELRFLRSQMNPHFLFNVLNHIYASSYKSGDEATASSIARLSDMMRHILEDSSEPTVSLEAEIEYLQNYVQLQRDRLGCHDNIIFNVKGELHGKVVAPMIFIGFIENAFKYGGGRKGRELGININFDIWEDGLCMVVRNHQSARPSNGDSVGFGIGLANVSKRLDLLYPESHGLIIKDDGDEFEVSLTLKSLNSALDVDPAAKLGL